MQVNGCRHFESQKKEHKTALDDILMSYEEKRSGCARNLTLIPVIQQMCKSGSGPLVCLCNLIIKTAHINVKRGCFAVYTSKTILLLCVFVLFSSINIIYCI